MSHRYSTASSREAKSAAQLLVSQGYKARAEGDSPTVVLDSNSVKAVEAVELLLLLRRAPTAAQIE